MSLNQYFDKVFVINLDRREDRLNKISRKLSYFKIEAQRFPAIDGLTLNLDLPEFIPGKGMLENNFAVGCLLSHLEVVKLAKSKGYKKILILEDDILISENIDNTIKLITELPNWKLLYLGASQYDWKVNYFSEHFYFCKDTLGTFAYALDESIYDDFIEEVQKLDKSIDNILANLQKKNSGFCFTFYPNVISSDVTESDIRPSRNHQTHSQRMKWNLINYL